MVVLVIDHLSQMGRHQQRVNIGYMSHQLHILAQRIKIHMHRVSLINFVNHLKIPILMNFHLHRYQNVNKHWQELQRIIRKH